MADESKGLPMAAKWDPARVQAEIAQLEALEQRPFLSRVGGYLKRTGPGLLQSAMTLGAGSAAASVVAGASFGYKLLWIQPIAMFLGVCMMGALSNVVLTTQERPYGAFGRETSRILVFLWALGTIVASVVWHFPQYGLVAGAARDLADLAGVQSYAAEGTASWLNLGYTNAGLLVGLLAGVIILLVNIGTTWSYGGSAWGIKLYEWFLRTMIGLVILAFGIVVFANFSKIEWLEVFRGFTGYYGIPQAEGSTTLVLGMLGAAVGINMTFLYPYSLLAKGWGPHHKKLARWDLGMSMFIPFVLVTSLIMLAMTVSGVYIPGSETVRQGIKPLDAAASLQGVMGDAMGRIVFDLGLIGMACGAISAHMVVCGFTVCEMFGLEYTKWRFRTFAMVPAIGILGVVTSLPIWFPIFASAICFSMLPVAYLLFLIMNNKRSYIGDAVGHGVGRLVFNLILVAALTMATIGAVIQVKSRVIDPLMKDTSAAPTAPVEPEPSAVDEDATE